MKLLIRMKINQKEKNLNFLTLKLIRLLKNNTKIINNNNNILVPNNNIDNIMEIIPIAKNQQPYDDFQEGQINKVTTNLSKKVYLKEYEKSKTSFKKYEEYFNNEYLKILIAKIIQCCEKNTKNKNFKGRKKFNYLVTSLFKNDKFKIDTTIYSPKTVVINLELLALDLLKSTRNFYESLIEVDNPNIGNILLCYFSQVNVIKVMKSILSQMENNIEKVINECIIIFSTLR